MVKIHRRFLPHDRKTCKVEADFGKLAKRTN